MYGVLGAWDNSLSMTGGEKNPTAIPCHSHKLVIDEDYLMTENAAIAAEPFAVRRLRSDRYTTAI